MSTNFFTGFVSEKPNSKVTAPPGGRSNNIFGFYEDEKKTVNNGTSNGTPTATPTAKQDLTASQLAATIKHNNIHGTNIFGSTDNEANRVAAKPRDNTQSKLFGDPVTNSTETAVKTKKRTGFNPITGRPYEKEDEEKEKEKLEQQQQQQQTNVAPSTDQKQSTTPTIHTSSRVLQPPGGLSTKLW